MASWLDKTGLTYFWGKCKAAFAAKSHTHSTQNLSRPTGLRGINDVTLQSLVNSVRANRLAFLPADQIIIEKTVDGGATWTDAGISDAVKTQLFSETRPAINLPMIDGKKNILCGLRVTFTAMKYNVPAGTAETQKYQYWSSSHVASANRYCQLKELYFWINSGPATMGVKLERATGANPNNWVTIFNDSNFYMNGYSGCDYISFSQGVFGGGITQTGNYWNYRLTFMTKGTNGGTTMPTSATTAAQQILEIRGYGDTWWAKDGEYMASDKLYAHDSQRNATFPAKVTATEFSGNIAASNINSGTLALARIPTGTDSTHVALGNHTHSSYVNQNAFSNVKVGSTTVSADTTTDTLELVAGSNVTLTPDATNDKVTIAASGEANQNAYSHIHITANGTGYDLDAASATDRLLLEAGSNITMEVTSSSSPSQSDSSGDKIKISATDTKALGSMTGTLGVGHGGTGVATLGAGVVYHSASGTGALSIATAANLVSALGTTAVNRATADASGNNIANTYYKKSELGSLFYGTCSTAAATQAKVVACSTFTSANLVAGCSINVKFTNAQTYNGAPTLNINSTGAKTVKMIGTTNPPQYWWQAGEMVTFVYDGTNWLTTKGGYATTTYYGPTKLSDAINSTSTTLAATANAAKKAYDRASAVIAPETGTVTLVYTGNGSKLEPGTGVWKSGHVVTVYLQYSSTVAMTWYGNPNNNDVVASIPTSFAPGSAMRFPMFTTADWGTYNVGYMTIQADGKLVASSKSTTCMFGVFTYVKTN